MPNSVKVYPLLFEPSLHVKVWGGRELATKLGKALPTAEPYGESWEIYWENRVANGPLAGRTLGDLIAAHPQEMIGRRTGDPEYPLLVKFIDAQDWLSVQVHPDDARAADLEGQPRGKTECWYILDTQPGAQIAYGLSERMDVEGFRQALGQQGRVKSVLQYVDVVPGDFIYVPAGMLHAIGPGVLLYELQQTSDTTYRVYDWDRPGLDGKPRELHIDKSLACMNFDVNPAAKVEYHQNGGMTETLIEGQYFVLKKVTLSGDQLIDLSELSAAPTARLLTVIKGRAVLGAFDPLVVSAGTSVFIPAAIKSLPMQAAPTTEILCAWER